MVCASHAEPELDDFELDEDELFGQDTNAEVAPRPCLQFRFDRRPYNLDS